MTTPAWIPVSEGLPEPQELLDYYLVSVYHPDFDYVVATATFEPSGKWMHRLRGDITSDVLAWMPLPEPYRPV